MKFSKAQTLELYDEELPLLMEETEKILRRERAFRTLDFVKVAGLMWDKKASERRKELRVIQKEIEESIK